MAGAGTVDGTRDSEPEKTMTNKHTNEIGTLDTLTTHAVPRRVPRQYRRCRNQQCRARLRASERRRCDACRAMVKYGALTIAGWAVVVSALWITFTAFGVF